MCYLYFTVRQNMYEFICFGQPVFRQHYLWCPGNPPCTPDTCTAVLRTWPNKYIWIHLIWLAKNSVVVQVISLSLSGFEFISCLDLFLVRIRWIHLHNLWSTSLPSVFLAHGPTVTSTQHQHCTTTRAQTASPHWIELANMYEFI